MNSLVGYTLSIKQDEETIYYLRFWSFIDIACIQSFPQRKEYKIGTLRYGSFECWNVLSTKCMCLNINFQAF